MCDLPNGTAARPDFHDRTGRPSPRPHRHPGGLWRSGLRLRLHHPSPYRTRFCDARHFDNIRARSRCNVTETANGQTALAPWPRAAVAA